MFQVMDELGTVVRKSVDFEDVMNRSIGYIEVFEDAQTNAHPFCVGLREDAACIQRDFEVLKGKITSGVLESMRRGEKEGDTGELNAEGLIARMCELSRKLRLDLYGCAFFLRKAKLYLPTSNVIYKWKIFVHVLSVGKPSVTVIQKEWSYFVLSGIESQTDAIFIFIAVKGDCMKYSYTPTVKWCDLEGALRKADVYDVEEGIPLCAIESCRAFYAEQKREMVSVVRAWYEERETRVLDLRQYVMDVVDYIYPLLKEIGEDAFLIG
jgi:hypothetical protein